MDLWQNNEMIGLKSRAFVWSEFRLRGLTVYPTPEFWFCFSLLESMKNQLIYVLCIITEAFALPVASVIIGLVQLGSRNSHRDCIVDDSPDVYLYVIL